jgi:phosphoglycolate phosphatase
MIDSKYKHIIWDWNGTLFDDAWLCISVMNEILSRRGMMPMTPERYETIFDFPVMDYYRRAGFDFAVDPFEQLSDEFIEGYYDRFGDCKLRSGTVEVLDAGQEKGLTMSILSAMEQKALDKMMKHFELEHYFVTVDGLQNHHAAGKVEIAKRWIGESELSPDEIVYIGDTVHDYEVAEAIGIDCYLIHSGHHSVERLAVLGVPIIDKLSDLYQLNGNS